ncbi:MAG: phosphoglucosamine mutase, partial [Acidimicrobiia bacterium]
MLREGKRLFGTDGVRGAANVELTPEFALALGRAAGRGLSTGPVVVGRDTRRSGEMLSGALQAGFHAVGIDTVDVGVLPCGAISYLTEVTGATMGAVVSASHNPAPDNGIKLLSREGTKLSDRQEDRIEARLRDGAAGPIPVGDGVGTRFPMAGALDLYLDRLVEAMPYTLRGIGLALDCANGAAYLAAPALFRRLKADVEVYGADPDGTNINQGCGATHPEYLARRSGGRIGLAFD